MKIWKYVIFISIIALCGISTSSCKDDKETDSFMVRYTAFVPSNASNCTVTYIDKVGDTWIPTPVNNVRGTFVKEVGPVYRGFIASITTGNAGSSTVTPGTQDQSYECQIEVSVNGGPYQVKKKCVSPTTYEIE